MAQQQNNLHIFSFIGDIEKLRKINLTETNINEKDELGRTALHLACYKNHTDIIKLLINSGASINSVDNNLTTPLHWTAYNGNYDLVKYFLANKVLIKVRDKNGIQPTHLAALRGHALIVQLFKDHKSFVNEQTRDNCGITPLHLAAYCGHNDVVTKLLDFDVCVEDNDKITPIMLAASSNHASTVEILLKAGARITRDNVGRSAILWAVVCGNNEMIDMILRRISHKNMTHYYRTMSIYLATMYGHDHTIRFLLHRSYNISIFNSHNDIYINLMNFDGPDAVIRKNSDLLNLPNAFRWAIAYCSKDIVEQFIVNGLNCKELGTQPSPPLHIAAAYGNCTVIQYLIDLGCNIDACYFNNNTPMHWAAANGHFNAVKLLLQNGANDARALLWAAASGHSNVVKLLIENGANINEDDGVREYARTPLLWAATCARADTVICLLDNGANIHTNDLIHWCTVNGMRETIEMLLERGIDVDIMDSKFKRTALQWAVLNQNIEMARFLLDYGAFVDSVGDRDDFLSDGDRFIYGIEEHGYLPIHYAVKTGNLDMIKFLIARRATVNEQGSEGSPLCMAVRQGNLDVIKLLIDEGCDINLPESNGNTPIQVAMQFEHKDIVRYLIERGAEFTTLLHKTVEYEDVSKLAEVLNLIDNRINVMDENGWTAMFYAVRCRNVENLQFLIEHGVDVNRIAYNGETAVHIAVQRAAILSLKLLIEHGANINIQTLTDGDTPLIYSIKLSREREFKYLLKCGANIEIADRMGRTPLNYAIWYDRIEMIRILLLANASITTGDYEGVAPIHNAVDRASDGIAELLIARGADINARTNNGRVPLSFVVQHRMRDRVKLLLLHGADVNRDKQLIGNCVSDEYVDMIKILVFAGVRLCEMCSSTFSDLPEKIQNIIKYFEMNPLTLKQLSRIACRNIFGKYYCQIVHTQCLPEVLQQYLLFEE